MCQQIVYHSQESAHLMGVNVSSPLAADQGSPLFLALSCMLRAVMSIASAAPSALQPGQSVHAGLQLPGESKVISELRLHVQERRGNFQFRG